MLPVATIEILRQYLARGAGVTLQLEDGSEMRGTVAGVTADGIRLHGVAEPIKFSATRDVLIEIGTDGPE